MRIKQRGFTLLEMLLVSAVAIALLGLLINYTTQTADEMRRNKTIIDMQQILNSALSYYTQHGKWPSKNDPNSCMNWDIYDGSGSQLQIEKILPPIKMAGARGGVYKSRTTSNGNFVVVDTMGQGLKSATVAQIIAGQLPAGSLGTSNEIEPNGSCNNISTVPLADCAQGDACYAASQVPPPGQNLNNARSVNFAGIYNSGACVPVPAPGSGNGCPAGMSPQIIVVPASVTGNYDNTNVAYPISSYSAYAIGPSNLANSLISTCDKSTQQPCYSSNNVMIQTGNYWRVCLSVMTENGLVSPTNADWGKASGKVAAFTRCAPANENIGSDLTVWVQ